MSIYAPHPWDALPAAPPAPGLDYSDALDPLPVKDALRAADLLRDADSLEDTARRYEDTARRYEDTARRYEDDADDARRSARKILETFRDEHPALADAIEADPSSIFDESSVRRAAHPADADPSQVPL